MTAPFANRPLRISLKGVPLDAALASSAASAFVRQALNAPALAEISFAEPSSSRDVEIGAELKIELDAGTALFEGEITAIENQRDGSDGHILRVRAYDKLHRLRKRQQARTFNNVTAADIVRTIASTLGLDSETAESGASRPVVVQAQQSDFDFLIDVAGREGMFITLENDTLKLLTLEGSGEPITLKVGRELSSVRSVTSVETMRRFTKICAWDVPHTAMISETAPLARQDGEEFRGVGLEAFSDLGERTLFNRTAQSAEEARGLAQADIDRAVQAAVVIEGKADGNPDIRPGRIVTIAGLDDAVDGRFTVTQVLHRFSEEAGYFTEFSTAPPLRPAAKPCPAFTYGIVIDLNDPDRLSRVRAKLPLLGDIETGWMPVVMAGAGKSKGFAVLPEIDDTVLVLFPEGSPENAIVLGGLYGDSSAPGLNASGDRPFVLSTANGQTFTLDAARGVASLVTSGGDRFELGPDGSRLFATRDLRIEAPGRTLFIRAKAVEFEEA